MVFAIFPLLAFVLALVCALKSRFRWALAVMLAGPVLMLLFLCALAVWAATLGDCPQTMSLGECFGGLWMATVAAAMVSVIWFGSGALGLFFGWLATRVGPQPQE